MAVDQVTLKLQDLKQQADAANTELINAQADMRNLQQQRDAVVEELKAKGLTVEELPAKIAALEQERDTLIAQAEAALRGEQG